MKLSEVVILTTDTFLLTVNILGTGRETESERIVTCSCALVLIVHKQTTQIYTTYNYNTRVTYTVMPCACTPRWM